MADAEPIIVPNYSGTPSIRGSRINVYHVLDHYLARRPVECVAEFYGRTVEEIAAAYGYIDKHLAELMPEYETMLARERHGNPPHIEALLAKSHEKLMRLKAEFDRRHADEEAGDARAAG